MKMRDPITTTISIITTIFLVLNASGLLATWGFDSTQLQGLVTDLVLGIVALVMFFANDSAEMRKLPGAESLQAPKHKLTLLERITTRIKSRQ